jgi:hypothetical protein
MLIKKHYLLIILGVFFIYSSSCKNKNVVLIPQEDNTVIVKIKENASTDSLEISFNSYDLKKEKILSGPLNIYLFTFNKKKITNKDLVLFLKESPLVEEAQLNRNVNQRN